MFLSVEEKVSIARIHFALHHLKKNFKNVMVDKNYVSWKKILVCFYWVGNTQIHSISNTVEWK